MIDSITVESARQPRPAAPFPGLRPFSTRDHKYFFGREDQTFALYRLLRSNHFVAVVGSSGSGKSSIVKAGLLPLLDEENYQSGKKTWQYTTMRPERTPMQRLANALAKDPARDDDPFFEARRDRVAALLKASSQGISEAVAHTIPDTNTQLVLVVDQFEELFRFSAAPQLLERSEIVRRREEATNFVQLLLAATRSYDSRIRVIITMRSDFIGDCALFQGLPEVVSAAQFLVPSLSRDQREEAIRKPIELSGATIETELVERLLNDSSEELDQLPILQHCLARMWVRAGASAATGPETAAISIRCLDEQHYRDIGGVSGALSVHADDILQSLAGKEKAVEQTFRALAEIDKDGRAVRRARPLSQLVAETGASREDVCAVLDKFRADDCSFIVPPLSRAATLDLPDETVIDVGHEALLRRWVRVSGDPDATGERADKRDIGWLRQEQKDGERYQFLRSCVDPDSLNEARLSEDQVRRYWTWWNSWKPNAAWAERYGGRFEEVERLVEDSHAASRQSRWWRRGAYAAAVVVAALVGWQALNLLEQQRQAANTFKLAVMSAEEFSRKILDAFNAGQVSTLGAVDLNKVAAKMYERAGKIQDNSETSLLRTSWLLVDADIDEALGGDKERWRAKIQQAHDNARKYLAEQPDNSRWRELLFGSLFRLGDIDLDRYIRHREPGIFEQAAAEYEECRSIAATLLLNDLAQPNSQTADPDAFALRRFNLAFATNKVGEAMQVRGDINGAIAKYREALELATLIEGATKTEWKLQSATTRIKISGALMSQTPKDLDKALSYYSEAIQKEEAVFANDNTNNIVRSNLAAAYEGRAYAYEQREMYLEAFKGYADSVKMFSRLVDDDARDAKWLDRLARVHRRFGQALERYARAQNEPLDRAADQYRHEIVVRDKLLEKDPKDADAQKHLRESQARLDRLLVAAPASLPTAQ
jgi:hypothetical protein